MPDINITRQELQLDKEFESYKYILGDFGIQILNAISNGARKADTIMMLSGVPKICVSGRIPVLMNLDLIQQVNLSEYIINQKVMRFLNHSN